jgi:hypothetical protein
MTDIKLPEQPDIPYIPDDYLKSDWYMILEDIDKHIFEKPKDKTDNDWFQAYILESCFSGIYDNRYLEQLLTYWVDKRNEIVKKMEKGNWSRKSVTGLKLCKGIIKYDRACFIAIKKYLEHRKLWVELAKQENCPMFDGNYNLPSIAKRFEPHFGFPAMKKVMGDLLTSGRSERIQLDSVDLSKILAEDDTKVKVARCPNTPWKEIAVIVISAKEFHIMYRGITDIIKPHRDNKLMNHSNDYSEECKALVICAMHNGIIKSNKITKKNISRYRDWLREYTGREDNPIKYTKVQGYVTEFKTEYPNFDIKEKRHKENDDFDAWNDEQQNNKWKDIKEY